MNISKFSSNTISIIKSLIRSFFWLLPFIAFLGGYELLRLIANKKSLEAPSVLGQHVGDAIKILSEQKLNVRILAQKEDANIPEGYIVNQIPQAGQKIKPHQSVFLVITRKPLDPIAPNFMNLNLQDIESQAKKKSIFLKYYFLENIGQKNTILAQSVLPGFPVKDKLLELYISSGPTSLRLFPSLKNLPIQDVTEFLDQHKIKYNIYNKTGLYQDYQLIIDQRPLSGSIINLNKQFTVQLTV